MIAFLKDNVQLIQLLFVVVASAVGLVQLHTHISNRRLSSTLSILAFVDDIEIARARWFAYQYHNEIGEFLRSSSFESSFDCLEALDKFIREKTKDELDLRKFSQPVNALNIVGFLIEKGYTNYDPIVPYLLENTFMWTWEFYEEYIKYRRSNRPSRSRTEHLEDLWYARHFYAVVQQIRSGRTANEPKWKKVKRTLKRSVPF
jgi:hypothetical protein